jgi:hypothetical protein
MHFSCPPIFEEKAPCLGYRTSPSSASSPVLRIYCHFDLALLCRLHLHNLSFTPRAPRGFSFFSPVRHVPRHRLAFSGLSIVAKNHPLQVEFPHFFDRGRAAPLKPLCLRDICYASSLEPCLRSSNQIDCTFATASFYIVATVYLLYGASFKRRKLRTTCRVYRFEQKY